MARREAPARKRMAIRSPDGAARHLIYSPPTLFPLCHLLFPATTFVRFASAPSPQSGVAKRWRHFWNKNGDSF
jgi:hypothetical protein